MLTIEEARAEVARLRTDGLPWNIKLGVYDPLDDDLPRMDFEYEHQYEVTVAWSPVDVDIGGPITLTFHLAMRPGELILDTARRAIRAIALHEIDEQLTVGGVRTWEPHLLNPDGSRRPILRTVDG